jgi:hypothetical protein
MQKCFPGDMKFGSPVFFWLEVPAGMAAIGKIRQSTSQKSLPARFKPFVGDHALFSGKSRMSATADSAGGRIRFTDLPAQNAWMTGDSQTRFTRMKTFSARGRHLMPCRTTREQHHKEHHKN